MYIFHLCVCVRMCCAAETLLLVRRAISLSLLSLVVSQQRSTRERREGEKKEWQREERVRRAISLSLLSLFSLSSLCHSFFSPSLLSLSVSRVTITLTPPCYSCGSTTPTILHRRFFVTYFHNIFGGGEGGGGEGGTGGGGRGRALVAGAV